MAGVGIVGIDLGRIMEDGGDYKTINAIESVFTDELTRAKVTEDLVEERICEAE